MATRSVLVSPIRRFQDGEGPINPSSGSSHFDVDESGLASLPFEDLPGPNDFLHPVRISGSRLQPCVVFRDLRAM